MAHRFIPSRSPLSVTIGTARLVSLFSAERGIALVLLELGSIGLFAGGIVEGTAGAAAPWFLLAVVLVGWTVRAVDLENSALFIPGGVYGAAKQALGRPAARFAASTVVVEHLLFGALAASAAGHSLVAVGRLPRTAPSSLQQISLDDAATAAGACLLGLVWLWLRQGRPLSSAVLRRVVTGVVAGLSIFIVFNLIAIALGREIAAWNPLPLTAERFSAVGVLAGIGACLFAIGTAE